MARVLCVCWDGKRGEKRGKTFLVSLPCQQDEGAIFSFPFFVGLFVRRHIWYAFDMQIAFLFP